MSARCPLKVACHSHTGRCVAKTQAKLMTEIQSMKKKNCAGKQCASCICRVHEAKRVLQSMAGFLEPSSLHTLGCPICWKHARPSLRSDWRLSKSALFSHLAGRKTSRLDKAPMGSIIPRSTNQVPRTARVIKMTCHTSTHLWHLNETNWKLCQKKGACGEGAFTRYTPKRSQAARVFLHCPSMCVGGGPLLCSVSLCFNHLVGLVVKASASRAGGPGFESRLRRDFFGVESYQ